MYDMAWVQATLQNAVERALKKGFTHFISGGALGIDQLAANLVLQMRPGYSARVRLTIARPFPSQDSAWPYAIQHSYKDLLNKASQVVDVSPDPYLIWKMHKRNKWMVDNADAVIAVWDGSKGGTANCVRYAAKQAKPVLLIQPAEQDWQWVNV